MHHSLVTYLVESSVCLLAFYLLYLLLLRNEICFRYNRFYLLGATAVSFLLPLLELPSFQKVASIPAFVPTLTPFMVNVVTVNEAPSGNPVVDWDSVLLVLYGIGVVVFAFRFIRQLYLLRKFMQKHQEQSERIHGITVIHTQGEWPTFSFFGYIFWDNSQPLTQEEQERILQHEQVHITQGHSYDLVYLEVLTVVFWFNPLLHLYRKALIATHEFLADAHVIQTQDKTAYGLLLAKQVLQKNNFALGHYFNKSLTLKRLKMIHEPNRRTSKVKQVLAFPLLGLLVLSLSSTQLFQADKILSKPVGLSPNLLSTEQTGTSLIPKEGLEMMQHLLKKIRIPASAQKNNEYGGVFLFITINEEGKLSDYKVLKSAYPSLEQAITKALQESPSWKVKNPNQAPKTYLYPFSFIIDGFKNDQKVIKKEFSEEMAKVSAQITDKSITVLQPMTIYGYGPVE